MDGVGGDRPGLFPLVIGEEDGVGTEFDRRMMQRCVDLAQRALGKTAPNPLVGAVVVQGNEVVGEGFHPRAGAPHAEVWALQSAGDRAQGATVYVNLEPCNHYGRTPPCTEALVRGGVAGVVVGMVDPDPRVSGAGIRRLREAGLAVTVGVGEGVCQRLNEGFVHRVRYRRPLGILKYAMTLDGKIGTTTGHSAWVTSPLARKAVHQVRSECDAVVVGGNTVRLDNPHLTTHGLSSHNPLRVVVSRSLDLPESAHLWDQAIAPTVIFTENTVSPEQQQRFVQQGVEVVGLDPLTPDGVMAALYERNCLTVLWECGGRLAARAIADGVIQKLLVFVAPKIIGGAGAPSPVGDLGLEKMTDAIALERMQWRSLGPDWVIEAYLPVNLNPGLKS